MVTIIHQRHLQSGICRCISSIDIHEAVFRPDVTLLLQSWIWVNLSRLCTIRNEGPVAVKIYVEVVKVNTSPIVIFLGHTTLIQKNELN